MTLADDAFWMALYPFEFSGATLARGAAQVDELLALTGIRGGRALDLACGPGRHAVALAQRGFGVTAVDLSPALLAIARERAATASVSIDFVAADMRAFVRTETFEFVLRMYSGQELRHALVVAGFSGVRLYGGLDGQPYGWDATRLVAVATK